MPATGYGSTVYVRGRSCPASTPTSPRRPSTPWPPSTRSGWAPPATWSGPSPIWPAMRPAGRRARRPWWTAVTRRRSSTAQRPGDHDVLDLVGPLADLEHLGVAVEPGDRGVQHVAESAVDLHRLRGGHGGHPAGLQLGHRCL